MPKMPWRALAGFMIAALAPLGILRADTLQTKDGRTIDGQIRLEKGQFIIRTVGGVETKVEAAQLAHAVFSPPDVPAATQPVRPASPLPGHGLRAEYYGNHLLANRPMVRIDPTIDFDWGGSGPIPLISSDFSVRWSGQVEPPKSGTYTFFTHTVDCVRLWVDGKLVIDKWKARGPGDYTANVELRSGRRYDLRMEYAALGRSDLAQLAWSSSEQPRQVIPTERLYPPAPEPPADGKAHGLKAEIFASFDNMTQAPRLVRLDSEINLYWRNEEVPDPAIGKGCGIRWTGKMEPRYSETYAFSVHAQGARLWIDGKSLVSQTKWDGEDRVGSIALEAGHKYDLRMEAAAGWGSAAAQLTWSSPSQVREIIPTARLTPPDDFAVPPSVRLIAPVDGSVLTGVRSLTLEAAVSPSPTTAPSSAAALEFYDDHRLLGQVATPPYRFAWDDISTGRHHVIARLAGPGQTVSSADARIDIIGNGEGTLPAPWAEQRIGHHPKVSKHDPVIEPDRVHFENGTFSMTAARGAFNGQYDACHFIYQHLIGDGDLVAHIAELDALPQGATAVAGIAFRCSVDSVSAAECLGLTADHQAMFTHGASAPANVSAAATTNWLKIERRGQKLNAFISDDAIHWQPVGTSEAPFGADALVGLIACGGEESDCSARFDHVCVTVGAPKPEIPGPGIITTAGSYIAGDLHHWEDGKAQFIRPGTGKNLFLPGEGIARIISRPLTKPLADQLAAGKVGVLLITGDFVDADIQLVSTYEVRTDSVLFGPKSFHMASQVAGIDLHDVDANPPAAFRIKTADGSIFLAKSIDLQDGSLTAVDGALGAFDIPRDTVREIEASGK